MAVHDAMDTVQPLVDWTPLGRVLLTGACVALLPLLWTLTHRRRGGWLPALAVLTLFLTFDLVVFGAYTRLTDSGLGCPDWPGCYGHGSPVGASTAIGHAEAVLPAGPVTHGKAWIEMIHRYLATAVGGLIAVLTVSQAVGALRGQRPAALGWAVAALVWVAVQGTFGALTVTWKLYPAIVTLHLLGGLALLALLAVQNERFAGRGLLLDTASRRLVGVVFGLCFAQAALGGWVSTNDAVLACTDLPTCQGHWWPATDFGNGFDPVHALGRTRAGGDLSLAALTAIHLVHRIGAMVLALAAVLLIVRLAQARDPAGRRWAALLAGLLVVQLGSGLINVVLGWPLATALAHSAGAAAWIVALSTLLARSQRTGPVVPAARRAPTLNTATAHAGSPALHASQRASLSGRRTAA